MSRRRIIQFIQLAVIIVTWTIIGIIITLYDYLWANANENKSDYDFIQNVVFNMVASLMGALIGGSFLVFYANVKFRDRSYGFGLLAVSIAYILIIGIITVLLGFPFVKQHYGLMMDDAGFGKAYRDYLFNTLHLKNILVWSLIVALTQFFLQMNNKFGHGILWDIIRGKYHFPREETRIFMFVDLNSSTTIAEKLRDAQYHELLKDFFADLTNPIIDNKGDIYQYVGDEVVIAWKFEKGIENSHCLKCFFDMKAAILNNAEKYMRKYGLFPSFKAGIHFGKVIAGEIGIMKRDITFSGDVLNTTSRIQSKCKEFDVEVIASDDLLSKLSFANQYIARHLGSIKLRGRVGEVELSTLVMAV